MTIARIVGGKGDIVSSCICKHNLDLSTGCASGNIKGIFKRNSTSRCAYCYGRLSNYHKFKPKIINLKLLEKDIRDRKVKILRIGKFTDPGYISLKENLIAVLTLCNTLKVRTIVITKLLEFDKEVAALLKSSNSVLHFSLGYDELEKGANYLGKSNSERLKIAKKYSKFGVKTYLRLIKDVTAKADAISRKAFKNNIPIIITPLRFNNNKLAEEVTNKKISKLKEESYSRIPGYLNPSIIHNDYASIKRRCGEIGNKKYCAKCGL